MSIWYHVSPVSQRESILTHGLRAGFGESPHGFGTGQTPFLEVSESAGLKLHGVYLTQDPMNTGFRHNKTRTEIDIWTVSIDEAQLLPDYPALVEAGAYVDIEEDGIWFDDDNVLHEEYGETIPFHPDPRLAIIITQTAMFPTDIAAENVHLVVP